MIGILDVKGKKLNPLTGKKYRDIYTKDPEYQEANNLNDYQYLAEKWSKLKVWEQSESIIKLIKQNQVLVIESGTGTGKTVILPKLALHALDYKGKIIVTVPRTNLAFSSAGFAADCLDVKLGEEVGFQHRGAEIEAKLDADNKYVIEEAREAKSSKTKLLFSTDGMLKAQINSDPLMKSFNVVIIDEVHERNSNMDILILKLRAALQVNKNLKLIITSATMDMDLFVNYFRSKGISVGSKTVSLGENKPVKLEYCGRGVTKNNVGQKSVDLFFSKINNQRNKGDTIIFANSEPDGKNICRSITKRDPKVQCLIVTAETLKKDESLESRAKTDIHLDLGFTRKVIVSTDVWESSITLANVIYVIDSGLTLSAGYDGERMQSYLLNNFIAKSQANQRKGRAGRVHAGFCYRMYNESDYKKMEYNKPIDMEINEFTEQLVELWTRTDTLEEVVMIIREMLTKPKKSNIVAALKTLHLLSITDGFMSRYTEMTDLGKFLYQANKVNDIRLSKSLYYAKKYNCFYDVVMIASLLTSTRKGVVDVFVSEKEIDKRDKNKYKHELERYKNRYGDMMAGYYVIKDFMDAEYRENKDYKKVRSWCNKRFIHYKNTKTIADQALNISYYKRIPDLTLAEDEDFNFKKQEDKVIFCLLKGLVGNLAVRKGKVYQNLFPNIRTRAGLDRNTFLIDSKNNYIIYWELKLFDSGAKFTNVMVVPDYLIDYLTGFEKDLLRMQELL